MLFLLFMFGFIYKVDMLLISSFMRLSKKNVINKYYSIQNVNSIGVENTLKIKKKVLFNNNNNSQNRSGEDERLKNNKFFDEEFIKKADHDIIFNITQFNIRMELLKKIESDNISIHDKLKIIDEYNKDHNESVCISNVCAGNLMQDWNFTL